MVLRRIRVGWWRSRSAQRIACALALLTLGGCAMSTEPEPLFRFAVLTDVQYGDKDRAGSRHYRESLVNLERCVADLGDLELAFVAHCGDVIDGRAHLEESRADLDRVLATFGELDCEVHHVIGNHCLSIPRAQLLPILGLERGHYSFSRDGWRFVVVDTMALGVLGVSPQDSRHQRAREWLAAHPSKEHPNARRWNGGLGQEQRSWLRDELAAAEKAGERVVVFAHHPVYVGATTPSHLAWDHAEVRDVLFAAPAFFAWFNGHDHAGGYAEHEDRYFVTLPGMVENAPEETAYAVIEVFRDRLELRGTDRTPSRTLSVSPAP